MQTFQASKEGFTLIEVLIVVVIIAVLAALVIPRMTGSPEKAKLAEAYQMIGALNRAQQRRMDLNGTTTPVIFVCPSPPSTCPFPIWIGMGDIIQKDFRYECDETGGSYCAATRWTGPHGLIVHYFTGPDAGKWWCAVCATETSFTFETGYIVYSF